MAIGFDSRWASLNVANRINSYSTKLESSVGKITSGMRINSAADDPAGIVTSEKMRDRIGALDQANVNAQNDQALVKVADSALSETVDIYQRLKELAVHATDGAIAADPNALAGITTEASALENRIKDIAANTKYSGQTIFGTTFSFYLGVDGTADSKMDVNIAAPGNPPAVSGVASADDAAGILTELDTNLNAVLAEQAKLGGYMNALGYINEGIENESVNLQSAHQTGYDTDIAREMTQYVKNSVLLQSAQLILSQHNQNAYSVLNLLSN